MYRDEQAAAAHVEQLIGDQASPDMQLLTNTSSKPGQYVFFDLDMGGSTNILFAMVQAAVVAKLLGRTLIIPPPQPWYLKDYGAGTTSGILDEAEGKYVEAQIGTKLHGPTTVSAFSDFFDMSNDGLGRFVPLVTFDEFVNRESSRLSLPWKPGATPPTTNKTNCRWAKQQGKRITGRFGKAHLRGRYYLAFADTYCSPNQAGVDVGDYASAHFWTPAVSKLALCGEEGCMLETGNSLDAKVRIGSKCNN
jgi:hypothetical protein